MKRKSFEHMSCPIAQSLEVVGEWWTPLIMRDILMGDRTRFDDLQRSLGIAPTVLTARLNHLVEAGLLERSQYSEHPPRYDYLPTEAGSDFQSVLDELYRWGEKWTDVPNG